FTLGKVLTSKRHIILDSIINFYNLPMNQKPKRSLKLILSVFGISLILFVILFWLNTYVLPSRQRPPRSAKETQLFPGISYQRIPRSEPRRLMVHIVEIDLTSPGIELFVTPGEPKDDRMEIAAQTTREFLKKYQAQVAINASFFYPIHTRTPWDYFPRTGDRVNVVGQAIANGNHYSDPDKIWFAFCISNKTKVQILPERCPENTTHAVSGNVLLIKQGQPARIRRSDKNELFPRTAVGVDASGKTLWLVIVDGRQKGYSEGITFKELQKIFVDLGAETALNLDGGGSTTLVMQNRRGAKILNSPIQSGIPMRQRPVANHLGVYALPNP
ncbi:MAG: phosphodiester glycosidase family protein, partial [Microcoleaceae cyanobacterium]